MSGENRKGREEAGQAGLGDRDTLGLPRLPYFPCLRWVQDLCPSMEKCSSWFHLMLSPGHVFPWRDSVAFSEQVPRTVRDCHSFRSLSQVVVVQAISALCQKYPRKHAVLMNFLFTMLREEVRAGPLGSFTFCWCREWPDCQTCLLVLRSEHC
jgi:hypothetical protein